MPNSPSAHNGVRAGSPGHSVLSDHILQEILLCSRRPSRVPLSSCELIPLEVVTTADEASVGTKGRNLAALCRLGLSVPEGVCVTDGGFSYFQRQGELPADLVQAVQILRLELGGEIAVRSSCNLEDGEEKSLAGVFETHYVRTDEEVVQALYSLFTHASSNEVSEQLYRNGFEPQDLRMSVVVQRLVKADVAGVVFTGADEGLILIEYLQGLGDKLVDGTHQGCSLLVNQKGLIVRSRGFDTSPLDDSLLPDFVENIFLLRRELGQPLDIEFAFEQGVPQFLQVRPLTAKLPTVDLAQSPEECLAEVRERVRRLAAAERRELRTSRVILSDANYSELVPRPTPMDDIYMVCFTGRHGIPGGTQLGRREMGYTASDRSIGIIREVAGKLYFSIGKNALLYHIGFPETEDEYIATLVEEYLYAVQNDPEKGSYPQMGLYLQDPTYEQLATRYGDRAEEYLGVYRRFRSRLGQVAQEFILEVESYKAEELSSFITRMQEVGLDGRSLDELVDHFETVLTHMQCSSCVDYVKTARLAFYATQRVQRLLIERMNLGEDEAKQLYAELTSGLCGGALTQINAEIASAPSFEDGLEIARKKLGHFAVGGEMLELRLPRLRDSEEELAAHVRNLRDPSHHRAPSHNLSRAEARINQFFQGTSLEELKEVLTMSTTYMALRETLKYRLGQEYLLLRDTLEEISNRLMLQEGDIYFLYPQELRPFIKHPDSFYHKIISRREYFENCQELELPAVLCGDDVEVIHLKSDNDNLFSEAKGRFLGEGEAFEGVVVNLDDYSSLDEVTREIATQKRAGNKVVLVAVQMTISHDALVASADGLVLQNAGFVAHAAVRARELEVGAIGGVRTRTLKTGMRVFFDPLTSTIKAIAPD